MFHIKHIVFCAYSLCFKKEKEMSDEVNFDPSLGRVIDVDIEKEMKKSFLDYRIVCNSFSCSFRC